MSSWKGFTATPSEEAEYAAAGYYHVPCRFCGANIWCNPFGSMLNGISTIQFVTDENPVSGGAYECLLCNETKHDSELQPTEYFNDM